MDYFLPDCVAFSHIYGGNIVIFVQEPEIKDRKKTETRRIIKPDEYLDFKRGSPNKVYKGGARPRLKWVVGGNYAAVPKRGQKAFGRIQIERIWIESVQDITKAGAIAEGVGSVEAYKTLWNRINGKTKGARWEDNPTVWVIEFKYLGDVNVGI